MNEVADSFSHKETSALAFQLAVDLSLSRGAAGKSSGRAPHAGLEPHLDRAHPEYAVLDWYVRNGATLGH